MVIFFKKRRNTIDLLSKGIQNKNEKRVCNNQVSETF